MNQQFSQEYLSERYNKIPTELRKAIASNANGDALFEIGKRHGLLIDKTGELAAETGLLMLGVTHPDNFVGNLAERLKVDRSIASKIADDINREIFAPVREHLRGMFGGTPQKEISEERLPETGRLTSKISKAAPSINEAMKPGNKSSQLPTTLEDLEAELERVLAEESSSSKLSKDKIEPLSVVKKPAPVQQPSQPTPGYKSTDPYREQVEEDLPNVRPKAYSAPPAPNKKEISEERLPETGRLTSKISPASGGQVSRTQPTPTPKPMEEDSPFSPLHEEKTASNPQNANRGTIHIYPPASSQNIEPRGKNAKPHDIDALPKFRGINMQSLLKEQGESKTPETPSPIEPIPPLQPPLPPQPKGGKDPYKEKIE